MSKQSIETINDENFMDIVNNKLIIYKNINTKQKKIKQFIKNCSNFDSIIYD
jgi:hypothetical protein